MPVIETLDLTKRYGRRAAKSILAVDRVSFSVEEGQVFGFLGPNGCGKTTTIGMLVGIINSSGGSFRLFGASDPKGLLAARSRVGATLETPNFYPYMSGRDNLRITATLKGVERPRIEECLEIVSLADRAKHRFRTYSLGMKQRLALAATMLNDPDLVILDEPANGLDPQGMREIREIIQILASRGKTIFLSSHLLWEVERTCTHVAIVREGRIVAQGSVADVVSEGKMALLRASDDAALAAKLENCPEVTSVHHSREGVVVGLRTGDLASVNRFLSAQGIFVSHLAPYRQSLEEAFMELTRDDLQQAAKDAE